MLGRITQLTLTRVPVRPALAPLPGASHPKWSAANHEKLASHLGNGWKGVHAEAKAGKECILKAYHRERERQTQTDRC